MCCDDEERRGTMNDMEIMEVCVLMALYYSQMRYWGAMQIYLPPIPWPNRCASRLSMLTKLLCHSQEFQETCVLR